VDVPPDNKRPTSGEETGEPAEAPAIPSKQLNGAAGDHRGAERRYRGRGGINPRLDDYGAVAAG
jgi:hypothetical protein